MSLLVLLLRLGVGAALLFAGVTKLLDPAAFATALERYQLFPSWALAPLAHLLPPLELLTGAGLLLNRLPRGAAGLATALSAGFVLSLGSAWARGLDVDCGCFGAALTSNVPFALARAGGLLGASALLLFRLTRADPPRDVDSGRPAA
jgi:uncharacterized membrane protein YphA (DoxX/SURF4 family)